MNLRRSKFLTIILLLFLQTSCQKKIEFPASLMEMNNPEYLIKNSGPWKVNKQDHIIVYYSPTLDSGIDSLVALHKSHVDNIINIIGMSSAKLDSMPKINVWIFANDEEKYKKTQLHGIHAIGDYGSVYYPAEHSKSAHEYGHILASYNWGWMWNKEFSSVIDEAFAYYVDEGRGFDFSYIERTKDILSNDSYSISNILAGKKPFDLFANIGQKQEIACATFIKYMIEKYGVNKFGQLWRELNKNGRDAFKNTYGKTLEELESEFYSYLGIKI